MTKFDDQYLDLCERVLIYGERVSNDPAVLQKTVGPAHRYAVRAEDLSRGAAFARQMLPFGAVLLCRVCQQRCRHDWQHRIFGTADHHFAVQRSIIFN